MTQKLTDAMFTGTLATSKLTGAMGNNDGSALTGVGGDGATDSANDPAINTNPSGGVGTLWANHTSGELYVCTDATANANVWTNVGGGDGDIQPYAGHLGGTAIFFTVAAGGAPSRLQTHYVNIATLGNSQSFGYSDISSTPHPSGVCGNNTRTVAAGGHDGSNYVTTIQTLNPNTKGNTTDFGDLTQSRGSIQGLSSATRAVFSGGDKGGNCLGAGYCPITFMDYISLNTGGTAQNFGSLANTVSTNHIRGGQGTCDGTSGFICGGYGGNNSATTAVYLSHVQKITIASTGNAITFGNLSLARYGGVANTDGTKVVSGGGHNVVNAPRSTIDYFSNASGGTATSFGSFIQARRNVSSACDGTRTVVSGTTSDGGRTTIEYYTMATPGNALVFGDDTSTRSHCGGTSGGSGQL